MREAGRKHPNRFTSRQPQVDSRQCCDLIWRITDRGAERIILPKIAEEVFAPTNHGVVVTKNARTIIICNDRKSAPARSEVDWNEGITHFSRRISNFVLGTRDVADSELAKVVCTPTENASLWQVPRSAASNRACVIVTSRNRRCDNSRT